MAHVVNFSQGKFDLIYKDIEDILKESDLSFANLEAPVDDSLPYSAYPEFNMHHDYPDAAIKAGFNVFSLANNHTNDKGKNSIAATKKYFDSKQNVYSNGLCSKKGEEPRPTLIEKNGWKILFLAVTEVMNYRTNTDLFYYVSPAKESRENFLRHISKLRKENPCDLFVLSIHCHDEEYVRTINPTQRDFYLKLLNSGADVVWANHPHVAKGWEVIADENRVPRKIIFHAQGNTISGQRQEVEFDNPDAKRAYTGEGFITQVTFKKDEGVKIAQVNPHLITTYILPDWHFVIKKLNDSFLNELKKEGRNTWAKYLSERKKRMDKIEGKLIWQ